MAKEQEMRNNLEGDIKSFEDREAFLNKEIEEYTKIHLELTGKNELAAKERQFESNVSLYT